MYKQETGAGIPHCAPDDKGERAGRKHPNTPIPNTAIPNTQYRNTGCAVIPIPWPRERAREE